jgi:hypothetical protein
MLLPELHPITFPLIHESRLSQLPRPVDLGDLDVGNTSEEAQHWWDIRDLVQRWRESNSVVPRVRTRGDVVEARETATVQPRIQEAEPG